MIHHWTENEELLDRFALGRIDAAMRAELEKHLVDCEPCKQKVEEHRKIVGAIRAFGRIDAKSRLRMRIDARKRTAQNVKWILRVAAMFVVVVGLGVYNKFWVSRPAVHPESAEAKVEPKPELQNQYQAEARSAEREVRGVQGSASGESPSVQSTQGTKPAEQPSLALKDEASAKMQEQISIAPPSAQLGAGAGVSNATPSVGPSTQPLEKKAAVKVVEDISVAPNQLWVEGKVLNGNVSEDRDAKGRLKRIVSAQQEANALRKDAVGGDRSAKNFEVLQLFSRETHQGKSKYTATTTSVRTLVERSGDRVKLYLDMIPELNEAEVRNAHVEQVSPDSVIVTVRNMRFGYKIPSGSPTKSAK